MSTVRERAPDNLTGIASMFILGLGLVALFANVQYFFLIWIIGFAVVLPIIGMLSGDDEEEDDGSTSGKVSHGRRSPSRANADDSTPNALQTLRDRYARGELTDDQFERKLDRLFETETPESAAEWRTRERDRDPIEE